MADLFRAPAGFERSLLKFALHQIIASGEAGLSAHVHPDGCAVLISSYVLPAQIWVSVFYDLTGDETPCLVTTVAEGFTHLWPPVFARAMVCALLDPDGEREISVLKSYIDPDITVNFEGEKAELPSILQVNNALMPRVLGYGNADKFADVVARGLPH